MLKTDWNYLEGRRVNGLYMGLFPYKGTVSASRVALGGKVKHTVELDEPIRAYGELRERIIVNMDEINRIVVEEEAR